MTISNRTLIKIASIGGIITCTMGLSMQWKVKNEIRQTDYYKEALKELRKHSGAVSLLGEPVREGDVNLRSTNNYFYNEKAHFEVSIKGSKQNGTMFLWANKINDTNNWVVTRIELGLENESDRRLLVKNIEK